MARLGRGHRKMQAELKKRQSSTNSFSKKIYAFLAAIVGFIALLFKYMFLALWWVLKQMFLLMAALCKYIYKGFLYLVNKISSKFRKNEAEGDL